MNAYDGFSTDLVGKQLETKTGNDNNTPSGALKKLMGA